MFALTVWMILALAFHADAEYSEDDIFPKCGAERLFSRCANIQNEYCNQGVIDGETNCEPGCICKPGMVRLAVDTDICVPKDFCYAVRCKPTEVFKVCEKCPKTCQERYKLENENCVHKKCMSGCFCKDRYFIANESVPICVPEQDCTGLTLF